MATRLDTAYDVQSLAVRESVLAYALKAWASLPSYREADFERFVERVVPRIEAGQKRTAELADAYIARSVAAEFNDEISRGQVASVTTEALRGVAAEEVFHRPFSSVYAGLSTGKPLDAAVTAGRNRLAQLVTTNLQLAKTHGARQALQRAGAVAFQRVLTGRENCALCTIASTQRYWTRDLLPIHPGCDCNIRPLSGNPGSQIVNRKRLEQVHDAVENQFGATDRGARFIDGRNERSDYLDLIVTENHGEIGPTLTWRHQKFTGASDIN